MGTCNHCNDVGYIAVSAHSTVNICKLQTEGLFSIIVNENYDTEQTLKLACSKCEKGIRANALNDTLLFEPAIYGKHKININNDSGIEFCIDFVLSETNPLVY